ncbi:MAG: DinB family protein [Paenibacillus sp.]|nr:DinB family protein [Paenibacillus sp.]
MQNKEQLLDEFSALISFVQSLRQLDEGKWITPIEEGKWTTRDVIAHIMLWDKFFFEEAIEKISNSQAVSIQNLDFFEFNKTAVEYAKSKDKQEIIDMTIYYRSEILHHLREISEVEFPVEHIGGDGKTFTIYSFLIDFILHDTQHMNQLKSFLSKDHA